MSAPNKSYDPVQVTPLNAEEVERARDEALAAIAKAADLDALKTARLEHAGDRSPLALANREIGALPPAARAEAGKRVGLARRAVTDALTARQEELELERDERVLVEEAVDVTLPWDRTPRGARHPLTTIQERVAELFMAMGYEWSEGPEVEAEWFNFDALNLPPDHPARSTQDTFWVTSPDSGVVLRTQTSPVQIRTMLRREPPIYAVSPGRVYRTDELDATHSPVFSQVEGLVVDKGISMAHLRGTLENFARAMFGDDMITRLRHGQPARAGCLRHRPGRLHRIRVRHGPRADPHVAPRRRGHARHGRGRRAIHPSVWDGALVQRLDHCNERGTEI